MAPTNEERVAVLEDHRKTVNGSLASIDARLASHTKQIHTLDQKQAYFSGMLAVLVFVSPFIHAWIMTKP